MRAEYSGTEITKEREEDLRQKAKQAMDEISRAADIGSFTLSSQALEIIIEFERKSDDTDHIHDWQEYLHYDYDVTDKYMKKFIAEAKQDLAR